MTSNVTIIELHENNWGKIRLENKFISQRLEYNFVNIREKERNYFYNWQLTLRFFAIFETIKNLILEMPYFYYTKILKVSYDTIFKYFINLKFTVHKSLHFYKYFAHYR